MRARFLLKTDFRQTFFLKKGKGIPKKLRQRGKLRIGGSAPATPDPKTPSLLVGIFGCRMKAKKTPFEVGRRCHVCSLRKILSGCRHSVPIGLVCLWVGAKIRHFFETNKFYSRKIILKPSERFFFSFTVNLPARTKKREIRPFLGLWQWHGTDSPHWHFLNGSLNLDDLRKMQHNNLCSYAKT